MKAFITGSTGLLGSNLVHELVNQGHEVVALVRSEAKAQRILGQLKNVRYVIGDMENVAGFAHELAGCDVLFHTAAYFREYFQPGDHWAQIEKINITGALELFTAAHEAGLSRIIDVSSSGVIDKVSGDESSPPNPLAQQNLYFKSKVVLAEKIKPLQASGYAIIQILPGWMMGPGDDAPTASGQMILDFINGKLPGTFDGGTSTVDARDVALGMILAVEKGKIGDRYIIGGEFVGIPELCKTLNQVTGIPAPRLHIPSGILRMIASLSEGWSRMSGKPTLITREGVDTLLDKQRVKSDKAIRELGVSFRPLHNTLSDEVNWFVKQGHLKAEQIKSPQTIGV